MQLTDFLPTTRKELDLRHWDEVDVILFSGDAYVDHPAFGAAVIGRTLEHGTATIATLKSWADHVFSLALPPAVWIRW